MNRGPRPAIYTVALLLVGVLSWPGAYGQAAAGAAEPAGERQGLDSLPDGWRSQAFGDFIATMHAAAKNGLSDADRAAAAAQWMDANDWQSGSRKHRVQLVELLDNERLATSDRFSARWTGYLVPNQTGAYTLSLWDYYRETAVDTKVWINDNLVLDCSGEERERSHRSEGIALTGGERVPIRVEHRFHRTKEHKIAKPNVILSWETETIARQIIPAANYQPPDDYQAQGSNGLKGEYFSSDALEGLVHTRLNPELSYVWQAFAIVPEYGDRQRRIVEPMIPEILASLNDPNIVGMENADAFWCAYALEEVLTTRESMRILNVLKNYPTLNAARSPRDLFLFYWRFRYLPDHLGADLVAQWCKARPLRQSQFGTYPNYDYDEYYGNYNYPWRLGNHLTYTGDDTYLESMLEQADGSCNVTLASVLSFSHKKTGTLDEWYANLDSQIDDPSKLGDVKASWLLARGFAEEMRLGGEPIPTAGRVWLDRAYEEAESEQMKRHVLGEICCRLVAADRCDEAHALLDQVSEQHPGPTAQAELADWRATIDVLAQRYDELRATKLEARRQRHADELQRRLDLARARGDQEAIGRYTSILQKQPQRPTP